VERRGVTEEGQPQARREQRCGRAGEPTDVRGGRAGQQGGRRREQSEPQRPGPVHFRHVAEREEREDRERRERGAGGEAEAPRSLLARGAGVDGSARATAQQREQRRNDDRPEQHEHARAESVQAELGRITESARALERERGPVVAVVPNEHRREQRER